MDNKIKTYKDLFAWQKATELSKSIYLTTKNFPKEEIYGITSQMRRASVSVASNIAEGFARFSNKEKSVFYSYSLGSLFELETQIVICYDIGYLSKEQNDEFSRNIEVVNKLISGLIRIRRSNTKY